MLQPKPVQRWCVSLLFFAAFSAAAGTASAQGMAGPAVPGLLALPGAAAVPGALALPGAAAPGLPGAAAPRGADGLPPAGAPGLDAAEGRGAEGEAGSAEDGERRGAPMVLAPTQFQSFVQQATGQVLPIFGARLFRQPQTFAPVGNIAVPGSYVLGPGDVVQLHVWGLADFSAMLTIDRNGQVQVPRVGALTLAGVRAEQLEGVLRSHVGRVFQNFELSAAVAQLRSIQVYVVGQARQPGTYTLSSLSTLINALFASGGPSANGSMRAIELRRAGRTLTTIDLYAFVARGDKSQDVVLQPGDVIVIPPVGPQVAVTGAFDQPGLYELRPNETIADVLAPGGGVPVLATTQVALLERIDPQATPVRRVAQIALDAAGQRTVLRDGDILTLLPISPEFANAVTLQGAVAAPLRHPWVPGMRLSQLLPHPDALISATFFQRQNQLVQLLGGPQGGAQALERHFAINAEAINWDYAVIERLNRQTLQRQLIAFNPGRLVLQRDATQDLELQPGDVVTIFTQSDLRVPQKRQERVVRIEGEVAVPGVYVALPGETLPQLIRRIGGLTPQAYVFGTRFKREEVRIAQQQNLDQLVARLEAGLQTQVAQQMAQLQGADTARATAIIEAQRDAQRQQLARLRTLRSDGRMALEIDPRNASLAALPSLPLEHGDHIVVPSVPGFVAAFGAVNNQNTFIFRPGRTVGEVFRLAGLTPGADVAQAFVLRADGTVLAGADQGGWFAGGIEAVALMPGDTVVVPERVVGETGWNVFLRNARDITQILANLGLGLAALRTL
ncbi:MAG: SLBB domain-containing protein [Serpentinimonas sp.]|nr:SLBB domain-containing protein [Serpentinimonas sp.]